MFCQSDLEGSDWASKTEQAVISNDTNTLQSQDCSRMAKSFISSFNEGGPGRLLDDTRLRPEKSCFLSVDVRQPDTYVAFSDTSSRVFQTSRSYPGLSLDSGHVDSDFGHVAHTESLLPRLNSVYF